MQVLRNKKFCMLQSKPTSSLLSREQDCIAVCRQSYCTSLVGSLCKQDNKLKYILAFIRSLHPPISWQECLQGDVPVAQSKHWGPAAAVSPPALMPPPSSASVYKGRCFAVWPVTCPRLSLAVSAEWCQPGHGSAQKAKGYLSATEGHTQFEVCC